MPRWNRSTCIYLPVPDAIPNSHRKFYIGYSKAAYFYSLNPQELKSQEWVPSYFSPPPRPKRSCKFCPYGRNSGTVRQRREEYGAKRQGGNGYLQLCFRWDRKEILEELTLGILSLVQTPSDSNLSRISQAKIEGHSRLYCAILLTTSGVATLGLLPPIARGRMEPVS